jgi:isoleucyl-tRNA synthetase
MLREVAENYGNYKFFNVIQLIEDFLTNDLSRNYIKMIRERSDEVYETLNEIRIGVLKVLAPICPFITEKIWQNLKAEKYAEEESIHLSEFPKVEDKKIDGVLNGNFINLFWFLEKGLAERDKEKVGLKWPLNSAEIRYFKKFDKEMEKILLSQLNVKKIIWELESVELNWGIDLDTELTPELEAEGYAREMSRQVQAFRKKLGLEKKDEIELVIVADESMKKFLEKEKKFIQKRTNAKKFEIVTTLKENFKNKIDFKIKDKRGEINIKIITTHR